MMVLGMEFPWNAGPSPAFTGGQVAAGVRKPGNQGGLCYAPPDRNIMLLHVRVLSLRRPPMALRPFCRLPRHMVNQLETLRAENVFVSGVATIAQLQAAIPQHRSARPFWRPSWRLT